MLVAEVGTYERPDDWLHGEKKTGKQFMLTETASAAIDLIAKELGISRSEVVERAARCGGMLAAKKFNPQTGACENTPSSNSSES